MDVARLLGLVCVDIATVSLVSVAIGATAPRWPTTWLQRDVGPLRLTRWDTSANYRRLGIPRLARVLPEAGSAFGGQSKKDLPRRTPEQARAYLVEARRGELVHWASMTGLIPVAVISPAWMTALFVLITGTVNATFIAILRNGRVRALERLAEPALGVR